MTRTLAIVAAIALALASAAGASEYLEQRAKPLVDAAHAEIRAVHLGRYMAQGRWNEILEEALYTIAPKGKWGPDHAAWPAAHAAFARAMREQSVKQLDGETGKWIRDVLADHYSLEPDQVNAAVAFYESPGGRVFRDVREKVLAEASYGLPYVIEKESREEYQRLKEEARQKLLNLPDEQTQAVYDFNESELGKLLLGIENNIVADVIGNIMRSDLEGILNEHGDEIARKVRAAVPDLPPRSDKVYLGTVTMGKDRSLALVIEYHEGYRAAGKYELTYGPKELHWQDVARGVPGIQPDETRFLYRDPAGRLSDGP